MTTIAFDGTVLAVDNALFSSNVMSSGLKMFHLPANRDNFYPLFGTSIGKSVLALSGDFGLAPIVISAICNNDAQMLPRISTGKDYDITGILLDLDNGLAYHLEPSLALNRITALPAARGGGMAFAYGAMIGGLNALNALKAAIAFTDYAGIGVTAYELTREEQNKFFKNYSLEEGLELLPEFHGEADNVDLVHAIIRSERNKMKVNYFTSESSY